MLGIQMYVRVFICVYIYIYLYVCVIVCVYDTLEIYIERERERRVSLTWFPPFCLLTTRRPVGPLAPLARCSSRGHRA